MTAHSSQQPTTPVRPVYARRPRQALVAAAVVAGVLLVQELVGLAGLSAWLPGGAQPADTGTSLVYFGWQIANLVTFSAGVFLLLWLVPTSSGDRLPVTLAKGLLAAASGVVVAWVLGTVSAVLMMPGRGLLAFLFNGAADLVAQTIDRAPLVMLVVVVQWAILRERRA